MFVDLETAKPHELAVEPSELLHWPLALETRHTVGVPPKELRCARELLLERLWLLGAKTQKLGLKLAQPV